MITIELTKAQLDELYNEWLLNPEPRTRTRCLVVYLRACGHSRREVARLARVDEDTVTNLIKQYVNGGLATRLKNNYQKPTGQLEPHQEELTELFNKSPPHTVNHAIEMIVETTGIRLKHSAGRDLLSETGHEMSALRISPWKSRR